MPKSNNTIIYNGEDDNAYSSACDYLLYERGDGSMICSNGQCGRVYSADDVTKHRAKLGPELQKRNQDGGDGQLLVAITDYTSPKKKTPTPGEIEDLAMVRKKSGMSITSYEEYLPDKEERDR